MFLCILQMVNETLNRGWTAARQRERTAGVVLEGIKKNDWRERPDAASELSAALAERGEKSVTAPLHD